MRNNKIYNNYKARNIIIGLAILALMVYGIMWIAKGTGEAVQEYGQGINNTQSQASNLKCQMNMRTIWQSIQLYSISHDDLPKSFDELVDEVGTIQVFQCSEPNTPRFEYIPGQRLDSPQDNILLYEPAAAHNGKCNVLRVSGIIDQLTIEELQAAIEQTKAHLLR